MYVSNYDHMFSILFNKIKQWEMLLDKIFCLDQSTLDNLKCFVKSKPPSSFIHSFFMFITVTFFSLQKVIIRIGYMTDSDIPSTVMINWRKPYCLESNYLQHIEKLTILLHNINLHEIKCELHNFNKWI